MQMVALVVRAVLVVQEVVWMASRFREEPLARMGRMHLHRVVVPVAVASVETRVPMVRCWYLALGWPRQ